MGCVFNIGQSRVSTRRSTARGYWVVPLGNIRKLNLYLTEKHVCSAILPQQSDEEGAQANLNRCELQARPHHRSQNVKQSCTLGRRPYCTGNSKIAVDH